MNPIRTCIKRVAISLCVLLLALPAYANTRVFYPDQEQAAFTVDIATDWTLTPQGAEEGAEDYFYVGGPNGEELAFRTIAGNEIEAAVEAHIAYLKENFTDLNLGKAVETKINGMDAMILPAVGTDSDGSKRELGSGWFKLSDSLLGELWYNVDQSNSDGKRAAEAVLNSLQKP